MLNNGIKFLNKISIHQIAIIVRKNFQNNDLSELNLITLHLATILLSKENL